MREVAQLRRRKSASKAPLYRCSIAFMSTSEGIHTIGNFTALTIDRNHKGVTWEDIHLMLSEHQIGARPFWKPIHIQVLYAGMPDNADGINEYLFVYELCLSSGRDMINELQDQVIDRVHELLVKSQRTLCIKRLSYLSGAMTTDV